MSQKPTRKGVVNEEKEKTDTPVKEMKKKMAANAEKEKAVAEKAETQPEKSTDKQDKNVKQPEKTPEKSKEEKKTEKNDKVEKEKKNDKSAEKKPEPEKPKDDAKADKNKKQKQNGHNGTETNGDAELNGNGTDTDLNGRVSAESSDELEVHDDDEAFPELAYDDSEDSFEPPTPDGPSRSYTRRSQAKVTRTPETPRPTSAKHEAGDDSKESKVLKMKDDSLSTDRKLRSADSPKPESKKDKKDEAKDKKDEAKDKKDEAKDKKDEVKDKKDEEKGDAREESKGEKADGVESEKKDKMDVEVIIDVEVEDRKPDTNFSKSRVKVSPYRRSMRLADQTASSVLANYTGNNTTMEMDITETSSFITEDPSLDDSYLSGLRSIRGRRSYKPLKEMNLRNVVVNRSIRSNTSVTVPEQPTRPTAPVVGRKRKPESDDIEVATDAAEQISQKRMRLLERIAHPFRRTVPNAGNARRAADIVGINSDLPLSAPVVAPVFDPETIKPAPVAAVTDTTPLATATDRDKRCVIM